MHKLGEREKRKQRNIKRMALQEGKSNSVGS